MKIFIAPVSAYTQYAESLISLAKIVTRPEDSSVLDHLLYKARGDTNRSFHGQKFLESDYDAIWLADGDMKFHRNNLEVLRSHEKDIVTGHYFRRLPKNEEISSIIALTDTGKLPYDRLVDIPDGGLHCEFGGKEISNCGFGNVLIKRRVIVDVMKRLARGEAPFALGPFPEVADGTYLSLGADYRFFAMARSLGYKIWLDASVEAEAEHGAVFWLNRSLYQKLRKK